MKLTLLVALATMASANDSENFAENNSLSNVEDAVAVDVTEGDEQLQLLKESLSATIPEVLTKDKQLILTYHSM